MKTKNFLIVGALLCGLSGSACVASSESLAIAGEFGTSKKAASKETGDRLVAPDHSHESFPGGHCRKGSFNHGREIGKQIKTRV